MPPSEQIRVSFGRSCLDHCRDAAAMRRTVTVALIVGTLLTLINQGDRIVIGDVDLAVGMKILANYLVPWVVSSIGYISARRASPPEASPQPAPPRPTAVARASDDPGDATPER